MGFHMLHKDEHVRGKKRLYMTATSRVYTPKSKQAMLEKGYEVYDMEDEKFGEVLYKLTFASAVNAGLLSDYRITIMIIHDDQAIQDLYNQFILLNTDDDSTQLLKYEDVERLVGTAFAINGINNKGGSERMFRVLGFANTKRRSKIFRDLMNMKELHQLLHNRMEHDAPLHEVVHVDGTSSDYDRNKALRELGSAGDDKPRMITNVKVFTEGVDVPTLDAVAFMDPRDSMVDIVQAVGRVMRSAKGKRVGHIIIPVPVKVDKGDDISDILESMDDWKSTGRVLRALQSHDGRLPENPFKFINIVEASKGTSDSHTPISGIQDKLQFEEFSEKFYTKVIAGSGIGKPGQMAADDIESVVVIAAKMFEKTGDLDKKLAGVLGLEMGEKGYAGKDVCKIAALLVINACLLHRRLQDKVDGLPKLRTIHSSQNPREGLLESWRIILDRDYKPIFEPALNVVEALPSGDALYRIVDRADTIADSLSVLGYDHAGPLYHKILGTAAKSDSANYTINVSAIMLAHLAFTDKFTDWTDLEKVAKLRIMDPACGTGTLLMATLKTIKDRINYDNMGDYDKAQIHRKLVEDTLCGLDVNRYAVQLAACNLTLGAPTVDYRNMNLYTMSHGPQPGSDDTVKTGSVEILRATSDRDKIRSFVQPLRNISDMQAKHVDNAKLYPSNLRPNHIPNHHMF